MVLKESSQAEDNLLQDQVSNDAEERPPCPDWEKEEATVRSVLKGFQEWQIKQGKPPSMTDEEIEKRVQKFVHGALEKWEKEYQLYHIPISPDDYKEMQSRAERLEHILDIVRLSGYISKVPMKERLETAESLFYDGKYSMSEICSALGLRRDRFFHYIREKESQRDV